jgi:hypothetical protein
MGKNKKRYFATILVMILTGYTTAILSQNLDSMPKFKRDSILIANAKDALLKYGPEYYREYKPPIIKGNTIPPKGDDNTTGENAGRKMYNVTFLYDTTVELLEESYAAIVHIWEDTGNLNGISFGNRWGLLIEAEPDPEKREAIPPMRYRQVRLRPAYETRDWRYEDKAKPKNIDELKRRGYEYKDGEWINPNLNVPPNADILKRKGFEEINGQWVKTKKEVPSQIK